MGKNKTFLLMVAGLVFFLLPLVSAVTWENSQARLTCTPDTSWSPSNDYHQYCELENKMASAQNIDVGFLFEQQLSYGRLYLGSLATKFGQVDNVTNNVATTQDCEIGIDGTKRLLTIQNITGTFNKVYCFQSYEQLDSDSYIFNYHDGTYSYTTDLTSNFDYFNLLSLNKPNVYLYENVQFNAGQTRRFKIEYSLIGGGKWDFWAGEKDTQTTYYLLDPWAENSFFSDDFNRADSGTVGNGWTEVESGTGSADISSNQLSLYSDSGSANQGRVNQDNSLGLVTYFNLTFNVTTPASLTSSYLGFELMSGAISSDHRCIDLRFNGGNLKYVENSPIQEIDWSTATSVSAGTTYEIIIEVNQTSETWNGYLDGVKKCSNCVYREPTECNNDISSLYFSSQGSQTSETWLIDDVKFYNQTFESDEAQPFEITAVDLWDNSAITTFNATINGTDYQTTNGTIITSLLENATSLYDVYVISEDYFPVNYTNTNISSNLQANLTQSEIDFACYEKVTSSLLSCDEAGSFYYNAGTYETQANVTGYYPVTQNITISALDNKTINFTGFANSWLNINAINRTSSTNIANFTINYTDNDNSWSEELTTSGFNLNNTLIAGRNYTILFSKTGFVTTNATLLNFSSQNLTLNISEANSINITIRKESDLSLITESITIQFSDENATITNYETSTGNKYVSGLTPSNYTISFISANYTTRTVDVDFNNDYQTLTIYLIATGSDNTIFTFQDRDDGSRIEGVTLSVQKLINTTWTLVESLTSDITGRTSFDYSTDVAYRFVATATNYQDKNWTLDPILFDSYIIKLDKDYNLEDNSDFNGVTVYFVPKTFKEDTNTTINFTFSNPDATFVDYGFNATWDGLNYVSSSGNTGIGSNIDATLEIVGSELNDRVIIMFYYELDNGQIYSFTRTYTIQDSNTEGNIRDSLGNGYGLGLLERILIVIFIALLVAGAGAYFGGALAGGVLAMIVFGLFSYTGFITWWLTLPSLIIMFIVATWRGSS